MWTEIMRVCAISCYGVNHSINVIHLIPRPPSSSLVPRPHFLTRRNSLGNQVEFLWLVHTFVLALFPASLLLPTKNIFIGVKGALGNEAITSKHFMPNPPKIGTDTWVELGLKFTIVREDSVLCTPISQSHWSLLLLGRNLILFTRLFFTKRCTWLATRLTTQVSFLSVLWRSLFLLFLPLRQILNI